LREYDSHAVGGWHDCMTVSDADIAYQCSPSERSRHASVIEICMIACRIFLDRSGEDLPGVACKSPEVAKLALLGCAHYRRAKLLARRRIEL